MPAGPVRVWVEGQPVKHAVECDALERELHVLEIEGEGRVVVPVTSRLTSLRLT
mgnify:FL=1